MDAVLFDMDGVLVDSEDYWEPYEAEELLPRMGLADLDVGEITGRSYTDIYDYLVETYDVDMEREEFNEWFHATARRIYTEDVALLPGAHDLIDDVQARGVPVGIVSSSPHEWIDLVRERFDLEVDAVTSGDAIEEPGKPEPHVFEIAAADLGVEPAACIAVEDSMHGIESARGAGMHVVGFRHGDPDDTDRSAADYVADTPAELREYLLSTVDRADQP